MPHDTLAALTALHSPTEAPDRVGKMNLYGWLIGSWEIDVTEFREDGTTRRRPGEWHFAWVLEGRAIQDVWIVPPRGQRFPGAPAVEAQYFGTTFRTYDPRIDAWQIQWIEPVSQSYLSMIGRAEGDDIVQLGHNAAGFPMRWSFRDITPHTFFWRGEISPDGGTHWRTHMEFTARRLGGD